MMFKSGANVALVEVTSWSFIGFANKLYLSQHSTSARIAGGHETDIEHNPWTLALLYFRQHFCGAVEIHVQWALTAAHQVLWRTQVDVRRFYRHPEYNIRLLDYDFSFLELDEPITVQTASPAALPEPNSQLLEGQMVVTTGWGLLSAEGVLPEIVHVVEVPVVNFARCQIEYGNQILTNRMFYAGDLAQGGRDACQGDGGGPVIAEGRLVGLVSWLRVCAEPGKTTVNVRVSVVLDWIYSTSGI
ncbi:hypothetical protein NQ318_000255 [Aromia moschata]|uniref:trypsin n=1 Tax=Aromia moschata TaxID=1265417 RepID=A0AAV8YW59_9CUCU|nr:hypothetical protein NQ318_000255 [Aromia moschata]